MSINNTHYASRQLRLSGSVRLEDQKLVPFDFEYPDKVGFSFQGRDFNSAILLHLFVADKLKSIVTDIFGSTNALSIDKVIFYQPLKIPCYDYRFTVDWWDSDSFSTRISYGVLTIKVTEVQ